MSLPFRWVVDQALTFGLCSHCAQAARLDPSSPTARQHQPQAISAGGSLLAPPPV